MSTALSARVVKVSEVLGVSQDSILKALDDEGISNDAPGLIVLDSITTTVDDLVSILGKLSTFPPLKLKAAAALLKDKDSPRVPDPVKEQGVPPKGALEVQSLADALKSIRPIQQWNDRELLEKYAQDRDSEVEQELHKRSQGRNFVILVKGKNAPGKEDIDIENSIELLKMARKRVTPSILPTGNEGAVSPVYPILSLNLHDRMVELCPFCGETLYKGFCEKCTTRFSGENIGFGDDIKAYIHLIAQSGPFDVKSFSDRKAVMASASKGLDDLRITWPSISQKFDELKMTGNLPKLRFISSRPTSVQDPFFMGGNRSVGNKSF